MNLAKDKEYEDWKFIVNKYIYNFVKKESQDINDIDYRYLYNNNYHPYLAAIVAVLNSREFKENKLFESLIIPTDKLILKIKN